MKSMSIYYNDLNEDAQKEYLELVNADDESDLNHEISPLAIIDVEDQ